MEAVKNFIITLVTMLILISAVEIIAPDNNIKKYIKFVLGLILVSVMISPITAFFKLGEGHITNNIKKNISEMGTTINASTQENTKAEKEKLFKDNLNANCNQLLKEKYTDKDFKSVVDCRVDFFNMTYSVDKIEVGVKDGFIEKIKKVELDFNKSKSVSTTEEEVEKGEEMKTYLSEVFKVSKEKIVLYKY